MGDTVKKKGCVTYLKSPFTVNFISSTQIPYPSLVSSQFWLSDRGVDPRR